MPRPNIFRAVSTASVAASHWPNCTEKWRPNAPQIPILTDTDRCAALAERIRLYEEQWALDRNGTGWSDPVAFPNSRSFKFSGLERGKDVWVRVGAANALDQVRR